MALWSYFVIIIALILPITTPFRIVERQNGPDRIRGARKNDRPIIGVLAQELSKTIQGIYGDTNYTSYIAASYVKFLEGAGARVVPISINKDKLYYENLLNSINGVLLPGGSVWFNNTAGYAEAGALVLDYAEALNAKGDHFPVWGTCLGFELMLYLAAGTEPRTSCDAQNMALPLHFKPDYFNSKMFRTIPKKVLNTLSSKNVTVNYHTYCVTEDTLASLGMDQDWHILSTNGDVNGIEFISSIESRTLPFYGTQFHPEKNGYEFKSTKNIPHSAEAIVIMQYFADFFVGEARKNHQVFRNETEEQAALIYNYAPTYTGDKMAFEQLYFFH